MPDLVEDLALLVEPDTEVRQSHALLDTQRHISLKPALRGLCHEMNNFLKVLKIKSVLFEYAPMVFKFFCCLVMEKISFGLLL